jgi:GDP-4-dehydro-6-deoxy-D-mannose reductase
VEVIIREIRPDQVFHLAGYAHVGRSFQEADAAWAGNLGATRNLYQAIESWGGRPRILFAGSGLVYGNPETPDQEFDEGSLLRPTSPYAVSKAAADLLGYQMHQAPGLEIIRTRPLNHIGPGQSSQYAVSAFASQVAAIRQGRRPAIIETGNLEACRDLTDVRDVVQAYLLLMDRGRPGEVYNIASGAVYSMRSILERLLALAGIRAEVRQQSARMRAVETPTIRTDAGKLQRETGWEPQFDLDQTLADTLAYWSNFTV